MLNSLIILVATFALSEQCYWNSECPFQLYSTKTPYDTVRGDIRDHPNPQNCKAISIWSLHRHGNRNPGGSDTDDMKNISRLKDDILASFESGTSQLCAQDMEDLRKWTWNDTLEVSQSYLTGTGYEELYDIAKRIREKYPHLLEASEEGFYFRTTNEQRSITSSMAFVHGLTDGLNLNLTVDGPWERDDVIRPYENCVRYQEVVKSGEVVVEELDDYFKTLEFIAVQNGIQHRLGVRYQLTAEDVYALYELCRFYRSWSPNKQSPWCAVFTNDDLIVLEYRDDVRHYHRNGYGSWGLLESSSTTLLTCQEFFVTLSITYSYPGTVTVTTFLTVNVRLGGPVLKDLYQNFHLAVGGAGKSIVSYFTHDTMMEMAFCAMGLYKDDFPMLGSNRNPDRLWRTSQISAFATNVIGVLHSCEEPGSQNFRVQIFVNEKETPICPLDGCPWEQFQEKFQDFTDTLNFRSLEYSGPELHTTTPLSDNAVALRDFVGWIAMIQCLLLFSKMWLFM